MKNILKNINQSGLTLIEMLMTLGIITLITSIAVVNYRGYGFQGQVDLYALKLSSDLRLMQSYSFGLKEFDHDDDPNTSQRPEGGWGIYFVEGDDYYTVFADFYDFDNSLPNNFRFDSNEEFQSINIGNSIIDTLIASDTPVSELSILFQPPDPTIWICEYPGDCSATTSAEVIFDNQGRRSGVKFNTYGLIDVNE